MRIRFLEKGGLFLVASINPLEEIHNKRKYAKTAGFEIYKEKDVTKQLTSYLNSEKKKEKFYSLIHDLPFHKYIVCKIFMNQLKELARLPGSEAYNLIGNKEYYYHFCFIK